jgi:hypothetical protein
MASGIITLAMRGSGCDLTGSGLRYRPAVGLMRRPLIDHARQDSGAKGG